MVCTSIRIGDRVRSFDFDRKDITGERACFVEGVVEDFDYLDGCRRYVIRVQVSVFGGKEEKKRVGTTVYPPVNGTPTMLGDVTDFVEPIYTI